MTITPSPVFDTEGYEELCRLIRDLCDASYDEGVAYADRSWRRSLEVVEVPGLPLSGSHPVALVLTEDDAALKWEDAERALNDFILGFTSAETREGILADRAEYAERERRFLAALETPRHDGREGPA